METWFMARAELKGSARRMLARRRRTLLGMSTHISDEARELFEEREADWEDRAANVTAAINLERLGEQERKELQRITEALARLESGTWGTCISCGWPIASERLHVLPEATQCIRCIEPVNGLGGRP